MQQSTQSISRHSHAPTVHREPRLLVLARQAGTARRRQAARRVRELVRWAGCGVQRGAETAAASQPCGAPWRHACTSASRLEARVHIRAYTAIRAMHVRPCCKLLLE